MEVSGGRAWPGLSPSVGYAMRTARDETHARTEQARAERTPTVVEGDHGGYAAVLLAVVAAVAALGWWFFGG